jgi:hypothetical protein
MSAKPLPQKLEDELNAQKYYKASNENMVNSQVPNVGRRRSIPASVQGVFNDSVERSMYDEIFGHMLPTQRSSQQSKLAAGSAVEALRKGGSSEETNGDFTTNLLKRLRLLEKEAKESRERLAAEVVKNEKLTEEVERLKRSSEEPGYLLKQLNSSRQENKDLQRKLQEMEEFLADYGLIWVGRDDAEANQTQSDEVETPPIIPPVSFSAFAKAISELNSIIYAEPAQVMTDNDTHRKARLVQAAERVTRIRLAFYHNGLMIQNGPFRPITSDSYRVFTKDILDGYFPSEFRDAYPDGVIFDLIDHHQDMYTESTTSEGQMSAQQFLNRLPKNVVHQGNVVSVRGDIEQRLLTGASGSDNSTTTATTDNSKIVASTGKKTPVIVQTIAQRSVDSKQEDDEEQHHSLGSIVKVHIHWIDRSTLTAAMFETSTVSDLRAELARHFALTAQDVVVAPDNVELRSAYPSKLLLDGMTMREAGLAPNGTVHARKLR